MDSSAGSRTVDWYAKYSGNWRIEDVEAALVAHPRRGLLATQLAGLESGEEAEEAADPIRGILHSREVATIATVGAHAAPAAKDT